MVQLNIGLIRLKHIANAERPNENTNGIKRTNKFTKPVHAAFSESLAQIIHRPT